MTKKTAAATPTLTPELLETLYRRHHRPENLFPDPLCLVLRHHGAPDGEVAGLLAAALAYGRAELIVRALEEIFAKIGPSPREALLATRPEEWPERFDGFCYRFHKGRDVAALLILLRQALARHGSLASLWEKCFRGDVGDALSAFSHEILSGDPRPALPFRDLPQGHPVRYFLASPASGAAAKRLCLYLRWMVRRDEIDPGHWEGLTSPAQLVIPLDTHVARVSRHFGLTARKAADWRTAQEITSALRRFHPEDPLRYDFSLFRHGMRGDGG